MRLVRKVGVYLVFVPAPPVVSLNQYCKLNRYSAPPGVFLSVQCVSTGPTVHVLVCARVPCVCPGSAPRCADWPLFPKCGRPTKWPTFAFRRHPQPKIVPRLDLTLSGCFPHGTLSGTPVIAAMLRGLAPRAASCSAATLTHGLILYFLPVRTRAWSSPVRVCVLSAVEI